MSGWEALTRIRFATGAWFAAWGVKTHNSGERTSFFSYSLHALVRVPAVAGGNNRASKAELYREPNLVEEFAVTAPAIP